MLCDGELTLTITDYSLMRHISHHKHCFNASDLSMIVLMFIIIIII